LGIGKNVLDVFGWDRFGWSRIKKVDDNE